jgi:hypothetical protein
MGVKPLACWDYGFESCRRHGYLSLSSVVNFYVETSAAVSTLFQRSPVECVVSECGCEAWTMRRSWSTGICCDKRRRIKRSSVIASPN